MNATFLKTKHSYHLAFSFALLCAAYFGIYYTAWGISFGPLRNLVAVGIATPIYGFALHSMQSRSLASNTVSTFIIASGIVLRLLLFPLPLIGSDDANRYLWDGIVQHAGINPYAFPPHAVELAFLRDEPFFSQIFRPDMRTVYPPFAQFWFRIATWIDADGFIGLKSVLLLHDIASLLLIARLLKRHPTSVTAMLMYAWSPLAITQLYAAAHLDGFLLPWLLLAVLWAKEYPLRSGFALGLSAMIRPITLLCLPALLFTPRFALSRSIVVALGALLAITACWIPFSDAGARIVESLTIYAAHWRFNGFLFEILDFVFGNNASFRTYLYLTIVAIAAYSARTAYSCSTRMIFALGAYLMLAPTIYPWYALPILALGTLTPRPVFVALQPLLMLSDLVFIDGKAGATWHVPLPALIVEHISILGLIAYEWLKSRPNRTTPATVVID